MKVELTAQEIKVWQKLHYWADALIGELYADGPTATTENWLSYWLGKSTEVLKHQGIKVNE